MSHTIEDLRRRLFEAIDGVKTGATSIEQAKLIGDLSQVIVNTAKVEVEYLRAAQRTDSPFLGQQSAIADGGGDADTGTRAIASGVLSITRHRIGA